MIPVASRQLILFLAIGIFTVIALTLVIVLVSSAARQQRRYLRTREHLGGRLLVAQDEERAAIARDLHDDVVQRLIALATAMRSQGTPEAVQASAEAETLAGDIRSIARGMHPAIVDHLGLGPALVALGEAMADHDGVSVTYQGPQDADTLDPSTRLALYRVAQEALGNIAHHADTELAWVDLSLTAREAQLSIRDTGKGMDLDAAEIGPGIGLTSMRERIELLGGSLEVESKPGKGTTVTATLPIRARPS